MRQKRLAIIGAGSSGLITLKLALDQLADWEIVCFEKGETATGCWGNPYPGFVSTSTKFTTQFSSFRKWGCDGEPSNRSSKEDFFRDGEYGQYLEDFVQHFELAPHIRLNTPVTAIERTSGGWKLTTGSYEAVFDQLIICTGLAAKAKMLDSEIPTLRSLDQVVEGQAVVVLGGGESGADLAHRLAAPALGNTVYLSLKNGVRVSPRYHPIRGVPSDFLRNRLLLSIRQDLRNRIGQKFVAARIRHQELFEKVFPSKLNLSESSPQASSTAKRKFWDEKLTARAKDQLFNTFHTKSDDFLDDVAQDRIQIIGPPSDETFRSYSDFDQASTLAIQPDLLCPMIGFTPGIEAISQGELSVRDFYLGCIHAQYPDLFLIGYARPIIGNIPSISEMQARLVIGTIAGNFPRPDGIGKLHAKEREGLETEFPQLNAATVLPVEMFAYCDQLARVMRTYPSRKRVGTFQRWLKIQLSPASTTHYLDEDFSEQQIDSLRVHAPPVITLLLLLIRSAQPLFKKK